MKTVFIVDDDVYIGDMLEEVLKKEGYGVMRAYSGTEAVMVLGQKRPDLILLDLMLPGMTGEEILPLIQNIPVIVVSAKDGVSDRVKLLRLGASDYITKPFDIDEMVARIDVQFRRISEKQREPISVNGLRLDSESRTVFYDKNEIKLTKTEFAILNLLMQNSGRVLAKSTILDRISTQTPDCVESSLKVHISNIRKKLKDISGHDYIEAVWGIGFKFL